MLIKCVGCWNASKKCLYHGLKDYLRNFRCFTIWDVCKNITISQVYMVAKYVYTYN